jgi:hypothetical protein
MDRSGRNFFYGLLAASLERRQFILWQWLEHWPKSSSASTGGGWNEFIHVLLYQTPDLVIESERLLILGPRLPVRFEWLTAEERGFIVHTLFAQRHSLFKNVKVLPNHVVQLSGYKGGGVPYLDDVWRRQLLRDVAIWLAFDDRAQGALFDFMECIHEMSLKRGDVWLFQLYATLCGYGWIDYLPCWGHGLHDPVVPWKQQQAGGPPKGGAGLTN